MLTHIITDLLPQQSTSRTAYPMKHSQNLRQTHLLPSLKATVKQETLNEGDHGPLLPGPGHMAWTPHCTGAAVYRSQVNSDCMLHSLGQTKFMPPNPNQM